MSSLGPLETAQLEAQQAAEELAERYEEINLLYAIGEILGRTVTLEEAAAIILRDIAVTVGARRGVIVVHDAERDVLSPVAARGLDPATLGSIATSDATSVLAQVFRERHARLVAADAPRAQAESHLTGALLAVPIQWTTPSGTTPLGVVALAERVAPQPFSAGDLKLVAAIATQIGTAIQNARLVRASLDQQRLAQEMQLAHELQMKLLPSAQIVAPHADAAARVLPARSVGGDFYHLFRLAGGRTGVMIGDVSGHGYQAALIMALAMSAAAIHAQRTTDPGRVVRSLIDSLRDELESTDMYLTLCYAVIDPRRAQVRYANHGHPHAFIVRSNGTADRLLAHEPPIGLDTVSKVESTELPWRREKDLLVLFTDGVCDARDARDAKLGERKVLEAIIEHRALPAAKIVDHVLALVEKHERGIARRDDLTMVVVRS